MDGLREGDGVGEARGKSCELDDGELAILYTAAQSTLRMVVRIF